jgi:hypothetical protein
MLHPHPEIDHPHHLPGPADGNVDARRKAATSALVRGWVSEWFKEPVLKFGF